MRLHGADALDMLAAMSPGKEPKPNARGVTGFRDFIRVEFALIVSLGTVAIFLGAGSQLVEDIAHPVWLGIVFLWLFVVLLWSAMSVVRHALRNADPYALGHQHRSHDDLRRDVARCE